MRNLILIVVLVSLCGCDVPSWVPIIGDKPPPVDGHEAYFLGENAARRWMNMLNAPKGEWEHMLNVQEGLGANMLYLYGMNQGDGPYAGQEPVRADGSQNGGLLDQMEQRMKQARKRGFGIILWLRADDSSGYNRRPMDWQKQYQSIMVARFDDLVSGYVVGLEANEYMGRGTHDALSAHLRSLTDKPIGAHMTPNQADFAHSPGITHFYGQFGWVGSSNELLSKARQMLGRLPGNVKLVLAEYDKSSDSGYGKKVVTLDPRFVGFGNGYVGLGMVLGLTLVGFGVLLVATRKGRKK